MKIIINKESTNYEIGSTFWKHFCDIEDVYELGYMTNKLNFCFKLACRHQSNR